MFVTQIVSIHNSVKSTEWVKVHCLNENDHISMRADDHGNAKLIICAFVLQTSIICCHMCHTHMAKYHILVTHSLSKV